MERGLAMATTLAMPMTLTGKTWFCSTSISMETLGKAVEPGEQILLQWSGFEEEERKKMKEDERKKAWD